MSQYDFQKAQEHFAARLAYTTGVHELEYIVNANTPGAVVVDVRFPTDFAKGHVPGAINLPKGKWQNVRGLNKDVTHYVLCYDQTCHLAAEAAYVLAQQGYKVVEVEGGFDRWVAKGFRVEPSAQAA